MIEGIPVPHDFAFWCKFNNVVADDTLSFSRRSFINNIGVIILDFPGIRSKCEKVSIFQFMGLMMKAFSFNRNGVFDWTIRTITSMKLSDNITANIHFDRSKINIMEKQIAVF